MHRSVSLFGSADYTVVVTAQGSTRVRQEIIQGDDCHYVRTWNGAAWGAWSQQLETAMHLDVKIVRSTVYLRHGALGADCDIVLLRKKSAAPTAGQAAQSHTPRTKEAPEKAAEKPVCISKGIRLSKGEPGKWYVPGSA